MTYDPESLDHRRALATRLVGSLERAGFVPDPEAGPERVYRRAIEGRDGCAIKVYTTIPSDGRAVRGNGRDAIRVVGLYFAADGKARPLSREKRVFRVGEIDAIVDRTIDRARECYRHVKQKPRCSKCGAVTFVAKSTGRDTCAALCWLDARQGEGAGAW